MNNRVLIIDDEENIRQMIHLTLEASGYEVAEAKDGMEAFAILGIDASWHVILLDQRLPMMEGTEVLRRIKVLAPSAAVVMMTAYASIELAVEAMKLGATDFLRKPMTPEIVRNSVAAALKKSSKPHSEDRPQEIRHEQTLSRTMTMNGFAILSGTEFTGELLQQANERRFIVRKPDGQEQEVVVEISKEAFKDAGKAADGVPIENAFWSLQAETFLSAFIWNDGNVPATGRLVLKSVDRKVIEKFVQSKR